jgi:hypothetical protein
LNEDVFGILPDLDQVIDVRLLLPKLIARSDAHIDKATRRWRPVFILPPRLADGGG